MHPRIFLAALTLGGAAWITPGGAAAQPAPDHLIPQSLQIEHKETLEQIGILTKRKGPAWALPMTDRVKAEQEQIFIEHTEITEALNGLVVAATKAHDNDAKEFAESAAADSLNDLEILVPAVLMVGDTLHSKLPAAH